MSTYDFSSVIRNKKSSSGKPKFDKRTIRQQMTISESVSLKLREDLKDIQGFSEYLYVGDSQVEPIIQKASNYPLFTVLNTKMISLCFGILKNVRPFSLEEIGKIVNEEEDSIKRIFNINDDVKKMKFKEDILFYCQYINFMEESLVEGDDDYDTDISEEYESD